MQLYSFTIHISDNRLSSLMQGHKKGDGAPGDDVSTAAEEEMGQPERKVQGESRYILTQGGFRSEWQLRTNQI